MSVSELTNDERNETRIIAKPEGEKGREFLPNPVFTCDRCEFSSSVGKDR